MYYSGVTRKRVPPTAESPGSGEDPPARFRAEGGESVGIAFLLAQLGAYSAARFAARLVDLGLNPAHAGILRLLATEPNLNQRELAVRLHALPSRIVTLIDELEKLGLVVRRRSTADRRSSALELTDAGRTTMASLRHIATAHEAEITAAVTPQERQQLAGLLGRLAEGNGLTQGVHPGYRRGRYSRPTDGQQRRGESSRKNDG